MCVICQILKREDVESWVYRPVDAGLVIGEESHMRAAFGVGPEGFVCVDCLRRCKIVGILHKRREEAAAVRADRPVDAGGSLPLDNEANTEQPMCVICKEPCNASNGSEHSNLAIGKDFHLRVALGVGSEDFVCVACITITKMTRRYFGFS